MLDFSMGRVFEQRDQLGNTELLNQLFTFTETESHFVFLRLLVQRKSYTKFYQRPTNRNRQKKVN